MSNSESQPRWASSLSGLNTGLDKGSSGVAEKPVLSWSLVLDAFEALDSVSFDCPF